MTKTQNSRLSLGLTICGVAAITACGGQVEEDNVGTSNEYLTRAMSCEHLSELLREEARVGLDRFLAYEFGYGDTDATKGAPPRAGGGEQAVDFEESGSSAGGTSSDGGFGSSAGGSGGMSDGNNSAPPMDSGSGSASDDESTASTGPAGHSTTNNQVRGVDEADILKTANDGSRIWLLHKNKLTTLLTETPQSLGLGNGIAIEGNAREMFVSHDRAVVFSDIYREEFETPNFGGGPMPSRGGPVDDGDWSGETSAGGAVGEPSPVPGTGGQASGSGGSDNGDWDETGEAGAAGAGGAAGIGGSEGTPEGDPDGDWEKEGNGGPDTDWGNDEDYRGPNGVQITIVSLAGDEPQVEKRFQVSGRYVSARKHDSTVRAVINESLTGPEVPEFPYSYWDGDTVAMDAWVAAVHAIIDNSDVSDWILPRFEGAGESSTQLEMRCGDFYAPKAGSTAGGLTSVVTFDLRDASLGGANILGNGDTVYANEDRLVIAHPEYWNGFWDEEVNSTVLHAFSVSTSPTTGYLASGRVAGTLNNQFSLDVKGDTIRAATTVEEYPQWNRYTQVAVLERNGNSLGEIGKTQPMAPDESIYAVRYIGDMAYVVTFLQVDPLFAIDLSTPTAPKVLGKLKIPGFSTYMHPLDSTHLLTIGRDGDEWSGNALALQIFDVSDPLNPALSQKHVLDQEGSSAAEYDHKSFTFYSRPEGDLLAIPFEGWSYQEVWDENGGYYEDGGYHSTLELFGIDIVTGIHAKGGIDHSGYTPNNGGCDEYYCYGESFMRRGVFIDKYLYSISFGAVMVHDVSDLADPVAVLPLP